MSALQRVKELCDQASAQIEEALNAEKVNKAAHTRLRNTLSALKNAVTPAKVESLEITKK